jgi:hypothetical protein
MGLAPGNGLELEKIFKWLYTLFFKLDYLFYVT